MEIITSRLIGKTRLVLKNGHLIIQTNSTHDLDILNNQLSFDKTPFIWHLFSNFMLIKSF